MGNFHLGFKTISKNQSKSTMDYRKGVKALDLLWWEWIPLNLFQPPDSFLWCFSRAKWLLHHETLSERHGMWMVMYTKVETEERTVQQWKSFGDWLCERMVGWFGERQKMPHSVTEREHWCSCSSFDQSWENAHFTEAGVTVWDISSPHSWKSSHCFLCHIRLLSREPSSWGGGIFFSRMSLLALQLRPFLHTWNTFYGLKGSVRYTWVFQVPTHVTFSG